MSILRVDQIQHSNGTAALTIDSSGRISLNQQPSFFQRAMLGSSYNSGTLTGGASDHNVGGHYNTSTGIFTAPISGYYIFGAGILVDTGTGRLEATIIKNASTNLVTLNGNATSNYDGANGECIAFLSQNDYVSINRILGTAYTPNHPQHYFWGRFLG